VSVDSSGAEANGANDGPAVSADGRFVAFTSSASNLVAGDTNQTYDVFVHDRTTGTTERVSVDSLGVEGNATSSVASISADGQVVAFHSSASNLVAGDSNGTYDVFVHDRSTGITERVSVDSAGGQADGGALSSLSSDGRRLAFRSFATNSSPTTRTASATSSSATMTERPSA
jgi:Tol biopolymer transport system component